MLKMECWLSIVRAMSSSTSHMLPLSCLSAKPSVQSAMVMLSEGWRGVEPRSSGVLTSQLPTPVAAIRQMFNNDLIIVVISDQNRHTTRKHGIYYSGFALKLSRVVCSLYIYDLKQTNLILAQSMRFEKIF